MLNICNLNMTFHRPIMKMCFFTNFWCTHRYQKLNLSNGMEVEETKIRVPSLLFIPLIICVALLYFIDVFQIQYYSDMMPTMSPLLPKVIVNDKSLVGFAINTPGCRIPDMDPFDRNIRHFIEDPTVPICNNGIAPLITADIDSIDFITSSFSVYNITELNEISCCYKAFWRVSPEKGHGDNQYEYGQTCTDFKERTKIKDEFIEVICARDNNVFFKDMFAFVPLKNTISYKILQPKPLNILVLGYDAVSRLNLHRQMPKTVQTLKDLGAIELLGYNKVGDNTFPNLIPVLTGFSEEELKEKCWPQQNSYFDDCHFIWHDYKEKGFITAYGEDSSWMGLFNYQRNGFKNQTVDYAYNYFNRLSEDVVGNAHNLNVEECIGSELAYKKQLDYVKKFVKTMDYNAMSYFGFFWGVSLSHDYLNKPKLGDEVYTELFNSLKNEGHLNNTVLIFMSDHGIRWGDIRQTFQGRMEERLPFIITVFPDWYKEAFPKAVNNFQRNARRLTTPFDLHETFVDLLFPYALTEQYLDIVDTRSRGISLFREISKERTCEDAGIDAHWCTCQQSEEILTNSTEVITTAKFTVSYINKELEGYAQCATLTLDEIINSRLMSHNGDISEGLHKVQDYMLTIRTVPGEAIFEVTVRHHLKNDVYSIIGTVSRLNLYGTQSLCITDFHLKLYCYCKSILE